MGLSTSQIKDLSVGDLVTHILYGNDWVGVILGFKQADDPLQSPRSEKALVQIQPGTKFEDFFKSKASKKDRVNDSLGYVTTHWLFKFEVKNADSRSTRDYTPES
tara:strand:+ start:170 stop:484 length:315 start_codon:yes stop_codon:yes gene_type:complete